MKKLVLLLVLLLAGCVSSPVNFIEGEMIEYDKDTKFLISEYDDSFDITIQYARWQFFPEGDAAILACRSQLTAIAWEHAEKNNREIENINEQKVRVSLGRNGWSGMTTCNAFVNVRYK